MTDIEIPAERVPVRGEFDVVVGGSGSAGVCAALAAARQGAKTATIEWLPTIGGIAATGPPILGNTYWEKGKLLSRGIPYELLMDLKADKAYEGDPARQSYFCHMAGRCVSADELAFSAIRVMGITMQMGQAVGIGAALAARNGMPVKEIPVDEVRSVLRAVDAFVERST